MKNLILLIALMLMMAACQQEPAELTVMTHDSFAISEDILAAFEEEHNVTIVLLPSGDTGAALNQAILSAENPLADVFYGVDNTFMGRALDAGIFIPYESEMLAQVPDHLELDESHRLTPIDTADVCLNYDISRLQELGVEPPDSLMALTDPAYQGLLVVENPATSSPGLSFLLATIATFGDKGDYNYRDYWADLRQNEVLVTSGWEDAYWGQFSGASDGEYPLVVSYASSPPAEVFFNELESSPTAAITSSGSCFRQIEFAGILAGTEREELAGEFIDYMLSETFQEDIPLNMFVFPANENAELPDVFTRWTEMPADPATLDPAFIDANREVWIETWTEVVLR
jgi:thiamine transport system substrate-binding protein